MINRQIFNLEVDHFQFYFGDQSLGRKADTTYLWNNVHKGQRVAVMPGLVAVTTARSSGETNVTVTSQDTRPSLKLDDWDGAVECSLELHSGEAVLWSPESDLVKAPHIQAAPAKYGVVVGFEGITSVNDELATEGPDVYHLILWGPIEKDIDLRTLK